MDEIIERCCGLDVHQATVVACVLVPDAKTGKPTKHIRTFATFTKDLLALRDWLAGFGVTHVAMESTGVYWKPVYAVLEGGFTLVVGNAKHIANVPGRKTDVKDSEWIAQLVRHGLIRPSFVPEAPQRALRDIVRYRRKLIESRTAERNRLHKLLVTANVKLGVVARDVFGVSGMAMLRELAAGETDVSKLVALARGSLRKKANALAIALDGRFDEHHRFLLGIALRRLDALEADIAAVDARIDTLLEPYREAHVRLQQIPGVSAVTATVILAEIGVAMGVFGSDRQLAKWAGLCPGNDESAGKQRSGRITKGNVMLKTALVEAAHAAVKTKRTYFKDKFHRLKARRGYKRAVIAIGHKILGCAYHMLRDGVDYQELGDTYLDAIDKKKTAKRLQKRLEKLGFDVELKPKAA